MLEVSEFYNFFGLRMNQEEGKGEYLKGYLLAQKDFLEHHLTQWIPEFCLKLQDIGSLPFYAWLARITSRFIFFEFELMTANLHNFNDEK